MNTVYLLFCSLLDMFFCRGRRSQLSAHAKPAYKESVHKHVLKKFLKNTEYSTDVGIHILKISSAEIIYCAFKKSRQIHYLASYQYLVT